MRTMFLQLFRAGVLALLAAVVVAPAGAQQRPATVESAYGWRLETATAGYGVAVTFVEPDGPAAVAGLEAGDVIVAADGVVATTAGALISDFRERAPGAAARLLALRDGQTLEITLEVRALARPGPRNDGGRAADAQNPEIVGAPQLVIDSGGHSGQVEDVVFTIDGAYLITASEDKTIRVWNWREGRTVRIIRGAIGEGGEGKILALAISPDGQTLAAAGRFDPDAVGSSYEDGRLLEYVRLFSVDTGEVVGVVGQVPEIIITLAFSPDGRRLATGAIDGYLDIWDLKSGAAVQSFFGHDDDVYSIAFTGDGERLVSGGIGGTVFLWDVATGAALTFSDAPKAGVFAVAMSPLGDVFATGDFSGEVRLWRASDGAELGLIGDIGGGVGSLAFSQDGTRLVVGCAASSCLQRPRVYDVESRAFLFELGGHSNVVIAAAAHPAGRLVATAGGDNFEIQVWDYVTGGVVARLEGAGGSIWAAGATRDGARIGWGRSYDLDAPNPADRYPVEFAIALPTAGGFLQEPEPVFDREAFVGQRREAGALRIALSRGPDGRRDAIAEITEDGRRIGVIERNSFNGFDHRAITLTPDGAHVFSGGSNGVLERYSPMGQRTGELLGHTTDIWDLAVTPDGRLLISASADQTVRIWNVETLELIVTIFQTTDGRWIMWTPQGYYDGSPDAGDMIGWTLSRGPDRSALHVSASQLGTILYRPKLVARALELGSARAAVEEALLEQAQFRGGEGSPQLRPLPTDVAELLQFLPPNIREVVDTRVLPDGRALFTIAARDNGAEIEGLDVFVGDRQVTAERAETPPELAANVPLAEGETLLSWAAPIAGGRNEIVLRARSAHGVSDLTDRIILDLPEQFTGRLDTSGRLRVLAIGVDSYAGSSFDDLRFAGADARAFVDVISDAMAPQSGDVDIRLLTNGPGDDGEPTLAEIEAALEWIAESEDGDTTVVFIAGHGDVANGEFFILPTDFQQDGPADFGVGRLEWAAVRDALVRARGRKVVFLDACRSGASSYYAGFEGDARTHRYVAFSSTSTDENGVPQSAFEDPRLGHGVFTYAVLEGLRGGAFPPNSERLTAFNLMSYISSEVYALSDGRQAPSLGGSGNFLLRERS